MGSDEFQTLANRLTNEMTEALGFTLENTDENILTIISTHFITFRICRKSGRSVPSKGFR